MLDRKQINIEAILKRKNLDVNLFAKEFSGRPALDASVDLHAGWLWQVIFSKTKLSLHGMTHACATAKYIPTLVELYHAYAKSDVKGIIHDRDIKLLQITMLLHDAAREADGKDYWEEESALFIYYYLKALNIDESTAVNLAEAMLNKDTKAGEEWRLLPIPLARPSYKISKVQLVYQYLIHDADCLDVKRARPTFDSYQLRIRECVDCGKYAQFEDDLKRLLISVDRLLAKRGENFYYKNDLLRKRFERSNGYLLMPDLKTENLPYFNSSGPLDEINMRSALFEGKVFARAVVNPAELHPKQVTPRSRSQSYHVTNAECELRKVARRKGRATTSSKKNYKKKHGNPFRSVSMIGFGSGVFDGAGYLIVNPDTKAISSISDKNIYSGKGKKIEFYEKLSELPLNEKETQLYMLAKKLQFEGVKYHTELTMTVTNYHACYFKVPSSFLLDPKYLFRARYLQYVYDKQFNKKLPIYLYFQADSDIRQFSYHYCSKQNLIEFCNRFVKLNFGRSVEPYYLFSDVQVALKMLLLIDGDVSHLSGNEAMMLLEVILPEYNQEILEKVREQRRAALLSNIDWLMQGRRLIVACKSMDPSERFSFLMSVGKDMIKNFCLNQENKNLLLDFIPQDKRMLFCQNMGLNQKLQMLKRRYSHNKEAETQVFFAYKQPRNDRKTLSPTLRPKI